MLSWLSDIFTFFGKFFPHLLLIRRTHEGLAFHLGRHTRRVRPGLFLYFPLVTDVTVLPTCRQTINLVSQSLLSSDGVAVVVGGILVFEICDIEKAVLNTLSVDVTISDLALVAVTSIVFNNSVEYVCKNHTKINEELRVILNAELEQFGVKVIMACLSDYCKAIVIKNICDSDSRVVPVDLGIYHDS